MCRALRAIATGSTYQDLLVLEWTGQKLLVSSRCLPSAVLSATALQQSCLGTSLSLSLSLSLFCALTHIPFSADCTECFSSPHAKRFASHSPVKPPLSACCDPAVVF
jgi:hypothetical protein